MSYTNGFSDSWASRKLPVIELLWVGELHLLQLSDKQYISEDIWVELFHELNFILHHLVMSGSWCGHVFSVVLW